MCVSPRIKWNVAPTLLTFVYFKLSNVPIYVYCDKGQTGPFSRTGQIIKYYRGMFSQMVSSSFVHCQRPHLYHLQDSDAAPRPEGVHPPVFSALRQSRVVSSTSEEEEALTEKFLKINCKYITDGKVRYNITYRPIDDYRHIVHSVFSPSCHIQITTNCCWLKNELSSTTNCQI